ncbi:MAG: hypothetical protein OWQ57_09760 [Sulfobacillus sp.]|nr:hypothetical protein [Sulfobacillus sp.]
MTDTWTGPNGDQFIFQYEEPYGMNHDVANGTDAFDPVAGLPAGTTLGAELAPNLWAWYGVGYTGEVFTSPETQGEYLAYFTGSDPVLAQILHGVQFANSDLGG